MDAPAIAKPRLRGVLHLAALPLSAALGGALLAAAPAGRPRAAVAIYAATSVLLFGASALYHRGRWSPRSLAFLRRLDHANIFLIIAGTYTPVAVLALDGNTRRTVLAVVWAGAIAGVVFRVAWLSAPRWLYVAMYLALGWVAVAVMPALLDRAGAVATALLVAGGAAYSAGAVVYALRRPDPVPAVFGFHEVFHALTLVGWLCHWAVEATLVARAG